MVRGLRAHQLFEGYHGSKPINPGELTRMMIAFSDWVTELEGVTQSIDLKKAMHFSNT